MSGYRSPIGGKNGDQACSSRQQSLSLRTQEQGGLRMIRRDDNRPFSGGRPQASRRAVRDEKRKDRPPHTTDGAATTGGSPSRVRRWVAAFRERPFRHACNPACGVYVRYRDGLSPERAETPVRRGASGPAPDETALNEAVRDGHAAREAGNTTMNAYTREDDDADSAGHNNPPKNDIGNGNGRVSDRKPENRALSLTGWKRPSSYGPDCRNKAP